MNSRERIAATAIAAILALGCHKREPPEAVVARSTAAFRRGQVESLEALVAKAESGDLVTGDQIAIGISEAVMSTLLNASLPREVVIEDRLRVRIDSAAPLFRGNKAGVLFRTTVSSVKMPDASAKLEMGSTLDQFRLEDGKLLARVSIGHFTVLESSLGDIAADALDHLVRSNTALIQGAIPAIEIPVQIEQSIKIGGLTQGPVVARPGALPLEVAVNQVLPVNERLWVLLKAKAGPWQPAAPPAPETAGAP
jgi:hypothetical protein